MSLRSYLAVRLPDLLQWLQKIGIYPNPWTGRTARRMETQPANARYSRHIQWSYRPSVKLGAPELRLDDPLSDEFGQRLDDAGDYFDTETICGYYDVPNVRIWPKFGVHHSAAGNFVDVYCGEALRNPKYEIPRAALRFLPLSGRYPAGIMLLPAWYHNFYHWMVDILPRLELLATPLAEGLPIIIPDGLTGNQRFTLGRALAIIGIDESRLLELDGKAYHFNRLILPTRLNRTLDPSPRQHDFMRRMMLPIADLDLAAPRIYVSRRDAAVRRIANEDEIEPILMARGFKTVTLSNLSPQQQAGLFLGAEAVIGHHGAGMTYLAYCNPGTTGIEIFQEGHFGSCFARLAQLGDLSYGFGVGSAVGQDTYLDPAHLTQLLDRAGL